MSIRILILTVIIVTPIILSAQSVGIGTDTPDSSAILDIQSTEKGLLVPRISSVQREAITSPAHGLVVFDLDKQQFHFWNDSITQWEALVSHADAIWTLDGTTLSNGGGNYFADNLVFGSPSIDHDGVGIHNGKMFYHKGRAAFRVGYAIGNQWDTDSLGSYSFAAGYNTVATGTGSVAIGYRNNARGNVSTAIGYLNDATGVVSTAFGSQTTADTTYTTSFGLGTLSSGYNATAYGHYSQALGNYSTAFGVRSIAEGWGSVTFGRDTKATGTYSTAYGDHSQALGEFSTAFWLLHGG